MTGDDQGALVPRRAGGGGARPERVAEVEFRLRSFRVPGVLAFLLAIPAVVVFGIFTLGLAIAGTFAAVLAPWIMRRMLRDVDGRVGCPEDVVELERSAYEHVEASAEDAERASKR